MKKYILGIIILAAIIFGVSFLFSKDTDEAVNKKSEAQGSASAIAILESSYDFGDIDIEGGKVSVEYMLNNTGNDDVEILAGITSCMCTEGEIGEMKFGMHGGNGETVAIPAGGEEVLKATFDPMAHGPEGVGPIKREIYLKTNSTITPELKVVFTGNVIKN